MVKDKYIKVRDLIPGVWYTCKHKSAEMYTFKFTHFEDKDTFYRVHSSRYIQQGKIYNNNDYFANDDFANSIVLADMNYVIQLCSDEIPQVNNSYSIF